MAIASVTSTTTTGYRQLPPASAGLAATANGTLVYTGDGKAQKEKANVSDAVQQLDKSLRVFKRDAVLDDLFLEGNDSSSFYDMVSQSTRTLIGSYNKLNDVLRSSTRISKEGAELLSRVQNMMDSKWREFGDMGITLNPRTGAVSLDENRLSEYCAQNPGTVRKLLLEAPGGLAPALLDVVSAVTKKTAGYYFNSTFDVSV